MNENSKKYGFWSVLCLIAGSVIGVGVFFKNAGVLKAAGYNPITALTSWVVVSILVIATIIAYIEISSSTKEERGTLANWSSKFIGEKAARTIQVFFVYLWSPIMIILLALLSGDFFLQGFGVKEKIDPSFLPVVQIGMSLLIAGSLFVANAISKQAGKAVAISTMVIKMLPLLTVLVLGLMYGGGEAYTQAAGTEIVAADGDVAALLKQEFTPILILAAAPGILFAYDGFIMAANVQKETKSKSTFKKALFIGMILVAVFYIALAIGLFLGSDTGSIEDTLVAALGKADGENLWKITAIFIGISALGVTNANIITGSRNLLDGQESGRLTKIKGVDEDNMTKAFVVLAVFTVLWLVISVTGGLLSAGDDAVITFLDTFSSSVVIGGYLVYVIVVVGALANRFSNKVETEKEKLFIPASIISIVGFGTIILYNLANSVLAGDNVSKFIISAAIVIVIINMFNELTINTEAAPAAKPSKKNVENKKASTLKLAVDVAKDKLVEKAKAEAKKFEKAATKKVAGAKAAAKAATKAPAKKTSAKKSTAKKSTSKK